MEIESTYIRTSEIRLFIRRCLCQCWSLCSFNVTELVGSHNKICLKMYSFQLLVGLDKNIFGEVRSVPRLAWRTMVARGGEKSVMKISPVTKMVVFLVSGSRLFMSGLNVFLKALLYYMTWKNTAVEFVGEI